MELLFGTWPVLSVPSQGTLASCLQAGLTQRLPRALGRATWVAIAGFRRIFSGTRFRLQKVSRVRQCASSHHVSTRLGQRCRSHWTRLGCQAAAAGNRQAGAERLVAWRTHPRVAALQSHTFHIFIQLKSNAKECTWLNIADGEFQLGQR